MLGLGVDIPSLALRQRAAAATSTLVSASIRSELANQVGPTSIAGTWRTYRCRDKTNVTANNPYIKIYAGYIVASATLSASPETPCGGTCTFRAAMITGIGSSIANDQSAGTLTKLTWFGMLNDASFVAAGGTVSGDGFLITVPSASGAWIGLITSDPATGISLHKGDYYMHQIEVGEPQVGQFTTSWNRFTSNKYSASGDRAQTSASNISGAWCYSKNWTFNDGVGALVKPAAVIGTSPNADRTIVLHGDSVMWGSAGANATLDSIDSEGLQSWSKKALNALGYSFLDLSTPATSVGEMYLYNGYPVRQALTQSVTCGAVLTDLGINDRGSANIAWNTNNIVERFQWYWGALHSWTNNARIVQCTLPPRTSATGSDWSLESNQTDVLGALHWCEATLNPNLRAGTFSALGTGTNGPDAMFDMALPVSDATLTKWATATPANTIDGLHPSADTGSAGGHRLIYNKAITDLPTAFGFSAPS